MEKLEIYNFANASHWMTQKTRDQSPYIESICNQRDTVSVGDDTKLETDQVVFVFFTKYNRRQSCVFICPRIGGVG